MKRVLLFTLFGVMLLPLSAKAALTIPLTVTMSETVTVTGTPRVAVDVGGQTRYAAYTSGSNTNTLTFTLTPEVGDVDLDGIAVSSPIDLNGGTMKDAAGNDATLTFTPPNTSGIKVNYPSLGMDFVYDADGRYTLSGTAYNDLTSFLTAAGGSFTRASTGTYFDSAGTLQTAASGTPRFDWDPITHAARGILIEESRTNSLRNSETIGAFPPSTLPTYWSVNGNGAVWSIVGTGVVNGLQYIDARLSGTLTSVNPYIDFESLNYIPAAQGQTWTASVYVQLLSGSLSTNNTSATGILIRGGTSGSGFVESFGGTGAYTAAMTRYTKTYTFTNASTQRVTFRAIVNGAVGDVLDVTLRIAAPQLEQGSFATSYIPTASAAVTRAADVLSVPVGSWFNANAGTLLALGQIPYVGGMAYPGLASLRSSTGNAIHIFMADAALDAPQGEVWIGGSAIYASAVGTYTAGSSFNGGIAYQANNTIFSANGALGALNTTAGLPSISSLRIGANRGGAFLNGWLQKVKYYPVRVPNAQLQALTQ